MRAIMKKMQALADRDDLIGFWCSLLFAIVLPSVLVGVLVLCIVGCVVAVAGSPFPSEADAAAEGYVAGKDAPRCRVLYHRGFVVDEIGEDGISLTRYHGPVQHVPD